ncbi:MAG: SH3 domain-containing protein [Acidobacteriota bacterium]|nr:SH3 domain-containing protein [Acidobacteriota bacterium]
MAELKKVLLRPGDELQILDSQPRDGFYQVQTEDGDEGWVAARNISIKEQPPELAPPPGNLAPANRIDETWLKPEPKKTTFDGTTRACPWNGDDSDPGTFIFKNRADTPLSYHDVTWDAIATLEYPVDKPLRKNWTPDHRAELARYEGIPLRAVGYLVAYKPQAHGSGEGTNCHMNQATETDTHLALVKEAGDAEKGSVVIEFTPRFLKAHPNWNKKALANWINTENPVRISGWLMFDPDHRNHLKRFRSTLWEIHPITRIEVWKDNSWVDLDTAK